MCLFQLRHGIAVLRGAVREAGSWQSLRSEFGMRVSVLLYPHIGPTHPDPSPALTLSPEKFERQVHWLARRGYVGIRPSDWLAWQRDGTPLPAKPVLLTFDEASADLADYAFPVLQRYGFGAAVFVVTSQVGGTQVGAEARGAGPQRVMTAEHLRAWAARGMEFGVHRRTQTDLTTLAGEQLRAEIAGSARELAEMLQRRVISFAYPHGVYSEAVRECVQTTFALAFTSEEGVNDLATDAYRLRRTRVEPGDGLVDLACRVHLGWSPVRQLRSGLARTRQRLWRRARRQAMTHALSDGRSKINPCWIVHHVA
jgi:peptidoglycan/xylan/chitin deacetylase (PgdA/CDA1 family)